ncbi:MAG: flagellar basal body rod protein FlgB [Moraxellaceae bacterium]|nr:flagellar basal body rod protein FlgB [Moraxellaceae bacterium]
MEPRSHTDGEQEMNIQTDANMRFHQNALNLRAQRQEVLASNIANSDTPHYKARDMDFKAALSGAVSGRMVGPLALSTTKNRHLEGRADGMLPAYTLYRNEQQSSVDGNTVHLDTERAAFAENALHYEASVTFINGLLRTMQLAVQGQ